MANFTTIHVVPAAGGEWAVRPQDAQTSSVHPTRGLAVAKAWEMVQSRSTAEVIVYGENGAVYSSLIIRRNESSPTDGDFLDEAAEEALRREAKRISPSSAELRAMVGRLPLSAIDYSMEDDELPCSRSGMATSSSSRPCSIPEGVIPRIDRQWSSPPKIGSSRESPSKSWRSRP